MTMKLPAKYLAARNALAVAHKLDEVKDIRDKALAMEVYAYQAKDRQLVGFSAEMKRRARRRIGELMEDLRKAGKLAKGGQPHQRRRSTGSRKDPVEKPSLAEQGIDKHLADGARKDAAMPAAKFEAAVAKDIQIAVAAVDGGGEVIKAARAERHTKKVKERQARESALAKRLVALPTKKYGVVCADPEWRFEVWSAKGLDNSSADNHYSTSELAVIKARDVDSIAADDSALFLWATVPMLPQALEVMVAWGFAYKSNWAWVKHRTGTGYWNRNQHEILLLGTRGKIPAPAEGSQWPSVITASSGRHSQKPEAFLEMIEAYFPNVPKIELNRRGPARPGWDAWGDEAEEAAE